MRADDEDKDAAPSGAILLPSGVAGLILCVCVDELAGIMWTGVLLQGGTVEGGGEAWD